MDREEAIRWLRHCAESDCDDCAYEYYPIEWCSVKMKECVDAVEEALSAEAEPKTGEWIEIGTFKDKNDVTIHVLHCQKCGALHRVRKLYTGEYVNANYCPNCGADMRGKKK